MSCMKQLSLEDKKAIEEIRMRMKNVLPMDMFEDALLLHRFLKAREFDLDKTEKMIRKNITWRKALQVDTIQKDFKTEEFFDKYVKLNFIGWDKDGDITYYSPAGKIDGRDVLKCVKINHYMKHWIKFSEDTRIYLRQLREKGERNCSQLTLIIDLDKLTIGNATSKQSLEICVRLNTILQDNYPECMKSMYIINAPSYYVIIFSILKAMMSNAMIRKIHVYGKSDWKEKFLEVIDADVLPAFLGGNRTDPDGNPMCNTFVNHGGKIPERHYLSKVERYFKDMSDVTQVIVPHKGKKEIPVDVTEAGSLIQWEFLVKSKDIGFGLFYKVSEQEMEEVLPVQRFETIDGNEGGCYKSQKTGTYIIMFDNSYSWMSSKEIEYRISVVKFEI